MKLERYLIPVTLGELLDRFSILRIKADRLDHPGLRDQCKRERDNLFKILPIEPIRSHLIELDQINSRIWDQENVVRACEAANDFGEKFIGAARAIYRLNDKRAAIKRRINEKAGQETEAKEYVKYA